MPRLLVGLSIGIVPPGTLYNVSCTWSTTVVLKLPMTIRVQRRYNNAVSVYRGYVTLECGSVVAWGDG